MKIIGILPIVKTEMNALMNKVSKEKNPRKLLSSKLYNSLKVVDKELWIDEIQDVYKLIKERNVLDYEELSKDNVLVNLDKSYPIQIEEIIYDYIAYAKTKTDKKVFIDPGHGGSDPGCVANNLREKDINLSVGKKAVKLLENQGINVRSSRYDDSYIHLNDRSSNANTWGAYCFISVHCNSSADSIHKGIETYCYDNNINDLARVIHNQIIFSENYTIDRGIKIANFAVLREAKMSACVRN